MGSLLGFHPPHFSEEEAWLPAWLQPSTIREASNQAAECPVGHTLEESGCLQQCINTRENGNLSDDGTCKSLHLFLSGEDNSQMNVPSCSSNREVQYHLHLSSIEESQYSLNPTLSRSQADKSEFNQPRLVQQPESKLIPEEDEAYMVPSQQKGSLGIAGSESPSFKEQKEVISKVDDRCENADISNAIELAVAASEALTIHKVLKDEHLIASSVLEATIRLKQACLENFGESLCSSIEESNEADFDFLSDLDYLTMADAYEDVGLTFTSHGDLSGYGSLSQVNDSFATDTYISNSKHKCNELGGLEVDFGSTSPKEHKQIINAKTLLKGSTLESFECIPHKDHVDYESIGTENAKLACDADSVFKCLVEQTDFCATEVNLQREAFSIGDLTSSQTILRSNDRQDKMTSLVPDRFQSRWFGGWTWKNEVSIPAVPNNKYKRSAPELFAIETSSLSESADIAPDMSSCMQRQDKDKTGSQSSVAPQCAYEKANNNGNLITDDVAVSPNVSLMDPLCSVVPCSFTSDHASQNSKHQANLENHLGPTVKPNLDNLEVNGASSPTVRRQVASLKTYSMLYPRCDPYLDKEHTRGDSSSFEHNLTAEVDVDLTSQREKETTKVFGTFEHNQTAEVDADLTSQREKEMTKVSSSFEHNQTAKVDADLTSQREKEMTKVSGTFEHNQTAKVDADLASQREKETTKVSEKAEAIVPRRKRVRFSETQISFPQAKKFQKAPQTRLEDPSVASRRLTRSKSRPRNKVNKTLFQDLKFLLTGFSIKKHKQIKILIQKNGGIVYDDIPPPLTSRKKRCSNLPPLILCPKKLLTTKFLYGCAVNAGILKVTWLFDSIDEGLILPHQKYKVLNDHTSDKHNTIGNPARCFIFEDIAIMLHGKPDFCSKMEKVIKHGGGSVFKTFRWLVKRLESNKVSMGVIVVEDENGISRQLKQCALEQKVPVMPFMWIINSLYAGRLLSSPQLKLPDHMFHFEMSEEI